MSQLHATAETGEVISEALWYETVGPFILDDGVAEAPEAVWTAAKRSLLDLIGVAAAGRTTEASRIAHSVAVRLWPPGPMSASLVFDGRRASPAGAAFAGTATIDSMDAHDGYKPAKGHAGVAVLPGLLALIEAQKQTLTGQQFLEAFIVGYEIACRVATAQHATCSDYHASGAWNAVGVAALAARLLKLSPQKAREAVGIAEYFGPRSQMMRVIDRPTMVKDSSSWGAMTGVTAAYLAADCFTGAPAVTIESAEVAHAWSDLGRRWLITEQYFKLWPICRWAQPAVAAALHLSRTHQLKHWQIHRIVIETFREARRLAGHAPQTSDQAQYSIAFPTSCAFVFGALGVSQMNGVGSRDSAVFNLAQKIEIVESADFNAAFPARRLARLIVTLDDGRQLVSPVTEPPGDPENPLSDKELIDKFQALAAPVLGSSRAQEVLSAIGPFDRRELALPTLLELLRDPPASAHCD